MTVKNGKPTTSAPIQFCAAAVSVMAFIVAASPLGTIGKPGADFSTPGGGEEVHWFKWKEKSNLSLQGWSTERLMFTGAMTVIAEAGFFAITAWAGAPSYWSIQSGGGFSVKKLPHDSHIKWAVTFSCLAYAASFASCLIGWISLRADETRDNKIQYKIFKPTLACLIVGAILAVGTAFMLYTSPVVKKYTETETGDVSIAQEAETGKLVHVAEAAVAVAVCCLAVGGSMPFLQWQSGGDGIYSTLRFIASRENLPDNLKKLRTSMVFAAAICHFLAIGISTLALCWIGRCRAHVFARCFSCCFERFQTLRKDGKIPHLVALAACALGTEIYAMNTVYWRVQSYVKGPKVQYGPTFWLVIAAFCLEVGAFGLLIYVSYKQKNPDLDDDPSQLGGSWRNPGYGMADPQGFEQQIQNNEPYFQQQRNNYPGGPAPMW